MSSRMSSRTSSSILSNVLGSIRQNGIDQDTAEAIRNILLRQAKQRLDRQRRAKAVRNRVSKIKTGFWGGIGKVGTGLQKAYTTTGGGVRKVGAGVETAYTAAGQGVTAKYSQAQIKLANYMKRKRKEALLKEKNKLKRRVNNITKMLDSLNLNGPSMRNQSATNRGVVYRNPLAPTNLRRGLSRSSSMSSVGYQNAHETPYASNNNNVSVRSRQF